MGTEGKKKGGEGRWQVGPRGAHVEKGGGGERWWRRLALELRLRSLLLAGAPRGAQVGWGEEAQVRRKKR